MTTLNVNQPEKLPVLNVIEYDVPTDGSSELKNIVIIESFQPESIEVLSNKSYEVVEFNHQTQTGLFHKTRYRKIVQEI
jgi:hypothetical protein